MEENILHWAKLVSESQDEITEEQEQYSYDDVIAIIKAIIVSPGIKRDGVYTEEEYNEEST